MTTREVADRFNQLAQEEKWFEIQDELFADNVISIEPEHSQHPKLVEGKLAVRKKGEAWVARITDFHGAGTSQPLVSGNHFAVDRFVEITVEGMGRIKANEIMLYKVENGQIVSEQFFY